MELFVAFWFLMVADRARKERERENVAVGGPTVRSGLIDIDYIVRHAAVAVAAT